LKEIVQVSVLLEKFEEYQQTLNKIPGVISSRIIADDSTIREVHILSDINRGPKQIVRDVQSVFLAKFNMSVDHRIISVAQIEDKGIGIREFRLNIDSVQLHSKQGKVEACVVMSKDEETFTGNATGGNSAQGRLRVVADATLKAVHQFLNTDFIFVLSDVVKINLADRQAIVVSILHFTDFGEEYLSGSAIIKTDDDISIVKATLDAVNRRLLQHYKK
jgi:hypothetical protein